MASGSEGAQQPGRSLNSGWIDVVAWNRLENSIETIGRAIETIVAATICLAGASRIVFRHGCCARQNM